MRIELSKINEVAVERIMQALGLDQYFEAKFRALKKQV